MNTIILTLSFVLVVAVYGAEEINIEQVFRNPFLTEVKNDVISKSEEATALKLPNHSENGVRNEKIISNDVFDKKKSTNNKINKFAPYLKINNNMEKKIKKQLFKNKKERLSYTLKEFNKNSDLLLPKENFQKRIWRFTNKKERNVFPNIEKSQGINWNFSIDTSTNKNKNITFSGLSGENKFQKLIRKFSTENNKAIGVTKHTLPVSLDKSIDTIKIKNVFNPLIDQHDKNIQNISVNPQENNINYNTTNKKANDGRQIDMEKLSSMGINMLSNLLDQQKMEGFIQNFIKKDFSNDSTQWNVTLNPLKNSIKTALGEFFGKNGAKKEKSDLLDANVFDKLVDVHNSSRRTWRSKDSNLRNEKEAKTVENSIANSDMDYDERSSLNNLEEIVDTIPDVFTYRKDFSILGFLSDSASGVVAKSADVVFRKLGPNIIKFVYRHLKEQKLFGTIMIYGGTTVLGVVIAVLIGAIFIFFTAAFTTAVLPTISSVFLQALTPERITQAYLSVVNAFDETVGIDKSYNAIVNSLLKLADLK